MFSETTLQRENLFSSRLVGYSSTASLRAEFCSSLTLIFIGKMLSELDRKRVLNFDFESESVM